MKFKNSLILSIFIVTKSVFAFDILQPGLEVSSAQGSGLSFKGQPITNTNLNVAYNDFLDQLDAQKTPVSYSVKLWCGSGAPYRGIAIGQVNNPNLAQKSVVPLASSVSRNKLGGKNLSGATRPLVGAGQSKTCTVYIVPQLTAKNTTPFITGLSYNGQLVTNQLDIPYNDLINSIKAQRAQGKSIPYSVETWCGTADGAPPHGIAIGDTGNTKLLKSSLPLTSGISRRKLGKNLPGATRPLVGAGQNKTCTIYLVPQLLGSQPVLQDETSSQAQLQAPVTAQDDTTEASQQPPQVTSSPPMLGSLGSHWSQKVAAPEWGLPE